MVVSIIRSRNNGILITLIDYFVRESLDCVKKMSLLSCGRIRIHSEVCDSYPRNSVSRVLLFMPIFLIECCWQLLRWFFDAFVVRNDGDHGNKIENEWVLPWQEFVSQTTLLCYSSSSILDGRRFEGNSVKWHSCEIYCVNLLLERSCSFKNTYIFAVKLRITRTPMTKDT